MALNMNGQNFFVEEVFSIEMVLTQRLCVLVRLVHKDENIQKRPRSDSAPLHYFKTFMWDLIMSDSSQHWITLKWWSSLWYQQVASLVCSSNWQVFETLSCFTIVENEHTETREMLSTFCCYIRRGKLLLLIAYKW